MSLLPPAAASRRRELEHAESAARIAIGRMRQQRQRLRPRSSAAGAPRPRSRSASAALQQRRSSSTLSALSTYTRARDSSAPTISNEGFSVVAPMKVSVPSSTCGRNASCCALLKRCTSSRNSTVGCPSAADCCACATASRMSLMPACTADSAMKRASERSAISRASVVLPVPGGPHRINECGWPAAIACVQRLARGQQMGLADELLERARPHAIRQRPPVLAALGERQRLLRRIALGHGGAGYRLWRADDVHAGRRLELQFGRRDARIALAAREIELHRLPEPIIDQHAREPIVGKAELGMTEVRFGAARLDADPVQAVVRCRPPRCRSCRAAPRPSPTAA